MSDLTNTERCSTIKYIKKEGLWDSKNRRKGWDQYENLEKWIEFLKEYFLRDTMERYILEFRGRK